MKPQSPIKISIQPDQKPIAGQAIRFTVTASSAMAADNFVITVHPPKGMQLLEGELSWRGAITQNEQKQISFTCTLPERGSHLFRANAAIYGEKGGRFAAHDNYRIGPETANKQAQPGQRVLRGERGIIEYPAQ